MGAAKCAESLERHRFNGGLGGFSLSYAGDNGVQIYGL